MGRNLVIFTGGKSTRMGSDKAFLKIGDKTFVEHIICEYQPYFENIILSVNSQGKFNQLNIKNKEVVDIYKEIGPIGGLYSVLKAMEEKEIFALSVDMPLAPAKLAVKLYENNDKCDICVLKGPEGRSEPLFAKYTKNCLPQIEDMISKGNYKMHDLLKLVNTCYIESSDTETKKLINLNTKDDYNNIIKKNIFFLK